MKSYVKNILGTAAVALFCLMYSSCSDKDEDTVKNDSETLEGDYSVSIEVSYLATGDDSKMNYVLITTIEDENQGSQDTVAINTQWTKTITCSTLPATVGFIAEPSFSDDVASGTEITAGYEGSCSVMLMCGDDVVDSKIVEIDEEMTFELSDALNLSDDYIFYVTEEGITRINYEDYISDDVQETEELPEEDQDETKVNGNLYYVSSVSSAEDEDSLHDNLVVRFASQSQWNGTGLTYGDFLLIRGSEIASVDETVLQTSLDNGCIVILHDVDSFDTLESFCDTYDIYCPLTEAPSELAYCLFILANADGDAGVDLDSDPDENIKGLFFMVSPNDDKDGFLSDYWQGLVVEDVVSILNDMFDGAESNAVSTRAAEGDALTDLVGAHKVYIKLEQTLSSSDYREAKQASDSQTNIYSVQYNIYNIFDISRKHNFYYIHQEFFCNFKSCYKPIYSCNVNTAGFSTIAKVCEWYASSVSLSIAPSEMSGVSLDWYSPTVSISAPEYTSSIDLTWNGEVGYKNRKPKVTSDSVYLSKSKTYSSTDVNVYGGGSIAVAWTYQFATASANFYLFQTSCTNMNEGAEAGRDTYTGGTDCLYSIEEGVTAPVLIGTFSVTLRSSAGKCGTICGERTETVSDTFNIQLPALSSSDFE